MACAESAGTPTTTATMVRPTVAIAERNFARFTARSRVQNATVSFLRRLNARGLLVPIVATGLLIVLATGGALANRAPLAQDASDQSEAEDQGPPPTADEVARVVDRLADAGVDTDEDTVAALAADHGLGGAVRLLAWSEASGLSVDEIAAMREGSEDSAPMGWGRIARELNAADPELDLKAGIGQIMGGGHGRDNAPGQSEE